MTNGKCLAPVVEPLDQLQGVFILWLSKDEALTQDKEVTEEHSSPGLPRKLRDKNKLGRN